MLTYRSETDEEAADGAEKQVQAVAGRWRERNVDAQNNISNSDGSKLEDCNDVWRASESRLTMARDCEVTSFRPQVCNLMGLDSRKS